MTKGHYLVYLLCILQPTSTSCLNSPSRQKITRSLLKPWDKNYKKKQTTPVLAQPLNTANKHCSVQVLSNLTGQPCSLLYNTLHHVVTGLKFSWYHEALAQTWCSWVGDFGESSADTWDTLHFLLNTSQYTTCKLQDTQTRPDNIPIY